MTNQETKRERAYQEWKEILRHYSSPENDEKLTEQDIEILEEAWWQVYFSHHNGPRYYRFEDLEAGKTRPITTEDKVRPVNVIEEGYWYCPIRKTEEEVFGNQEIHTEITGGYIAKIPMEAISEAKRAAFVASMPGARNLIRLEVLLSSKLKFAGQQQPRWVPVQLSTDIEKEEFDKAARQWLEENGYQIIE